MSLKLIQKANEKLRTFTVTKASKHCDKLAKKAKQDLYLIRTTNDKLEILTYEAYTLIGTGLLHVGYAN